MTFQILNILTIALLVVFTFVAGMTHDQNDACQVWIKTELIALILEIPFFAIQYKIILNKKTKILEDLMSKVQNVNDSFDSDKDENKEGGDDECAKIDQAATQIFNKAQT